MRSAAKWLIGLMGGLALALVGAAGLAVEQPSAPGEALYPLQRVLVEARLALIDDPTALAEQRLDALEKRLDDLHAQAATPRVTPAYAEYNRALDQAIDAIAAAPQPDQARLHRQLRQVAARFRELLPGLRGLAEADPALYAEAAVKTGVVLQLLAGSDMASGDGSEDQGSAIPAGATPLPASTPSSSATATAVTIDGRPVPFPPNATPGPHISFPLTGQHVLAQCAACHAEGRYQGTVSQCADCHQAAMPAPHFAGTCDRCHATAGWTAVSFDHTGATDCLGCHLPDRPAAHFAGQCSQCHTTATWPGAVFNHANIGTSDCAACHVPPPNHFTGPCTACHTDTRSFRNASFSHAFPINHGSANGNCAACHAGSTAPPYTCGNCHAPERMQDKHDEVASFGPNCTACHADGRELDED